MSGQCWPAFLKTYDKSTTPEKQPSSTTSLRGWMLTSATESVVHALASTVINADAPAKQTTGMPPMVNADRRRPTIIIIIIIIITIIIIIIIIVVVVVVITHDYTFGPVQPLDPLFHLPSDYWARGQLFYRPSGCQSHIWKTSSPRDT